MTPLVLVTGFLGAGKTTLLQNLAAGPDGPELVFLVNEFADLNIDATRLGGLGSEVFEVTGGSLFCECKVTDFIENLEAIHQFVAVTRHRLKGVVIETSGIADPEVMAKLLGETGLSAKFRIARIIALVAPYRFAAYLSAYPNLEAQIRTSDWVLLNKSDTAEETTLIDVERRIRSIKPDVHLQRTTYAQLDFDVWAGAQCHGESGGLSACANPYACISARPDARTSVSALRRFCDAHGERLLRVKGTLNDVCGAKLVDFSNGAFSVRPTHRSKEGNHLVLIVPEALESWARTCKAELENGDLASS